MVNVNTAIKFLIVILIGLVAIGAIIAAEPYFTNNDKSGDDDNSLPDGWVEPNQNQNPNDGNSGNTGNSGNNGQVSLIPSQPTTPQWVDAPQGSGFREYATYPVVDLRP